MDTSAQEWSNLRSHDVEVDADTLTLDTLSVIPESFKLHYMDGSPVGSDLYVLEWFSGKLIVKPELKGRALTASYRVFSMLFSERTFNKDPSLIQAKVDEPVNPFNYTVRKRSVDELFDLGTLTKSGSISRGIQVGNNQDLGGHIEFEPQPQRPDHPADRHPGGDHRQQHPFPTGREHPAVAGLRPDIHPAFHR
jgi:hypothetical protein